MRHSIKMLLAVLLTVMSFLAVQTAWAENPDLLESEPLIASGVITDIDPENSIITIGEIEIKGFPFGYLEREMDVEFAVGDCVEVEYAIVVCRCSEGSKNIAVALNSYCEATIEGGCEYIDYCFDDRIVLRDEDFYPVDKSRYGDEGDENRLRRNDNHPVPISPGD